MKAKALLILVALSLPAIAFSAAEKQEPLKLKNGKTYTDWKITSETATAVVVRYKGGAAKIDKTLLPPSVLAQHPINDEAAKLEAEKLAEADRAGKQRIAELAAKKAADLASKDAAAADQQGRFNTQLADRRTDAAVSRTLASEAALAPENLQALVRVRAQRYYQAERHTGSGSTLVFGLQIELEEPRPVPGWEGRYEVSGVASYQYYDSVWGGSFSKGTGRFSAYVDTKTGRPKVTDFNAL